MKLITDLATIKKSAKKRERENMEFRTFLKFCDRSSQEIDALVQRINAEVTAKIDCTQCANCCKEIIISLDESDITNFAEGLQMPEEKFIT